MDALVEGVAVGIHLLPNRIHAILTSDDIDNLGIDSIMAKTTTDRMITVAAPVDVCFRLACDPIKMNKLQPIDGVTIEDHDGNLTHTGTTFTEVSTIMGIKITSHYTATEVIPNQHIIFDVKSNGVNTAMSWKFEPQGDTTVVNYISTAQSENFLAGIIMRLTKGSFDKIVDGFLVNYKAEAERLAEKS